MTKFCEICEEEKEDVKTLMASPGRDYPGVGGPSRPPEFVDVCLECRE